MSKSLFVGNIPYGAMEKEIKAHFGSVGTVEEVHFIMDWRRGRFKGYGFVTMPEEDADRALRELDGSAFQDRLLKVSDARQRDRSTAPAPSPR